MRTLDERMAEIHRRSQARLLARRKRRAALLACAPAVLCIGLFLFALPDGRLPRADSQHISCTPQSSAEVSGNGIRLQHTEEEKVRRITALISTLSQSSGNSYSEAKTDSLTDSPEARYVIRITENGTVREYSLTGRLLTDLSSSTVYKLTGWEYSSLLQALGIPSP